MFNYVSNSVLNFQTIASFQLALVLYVTLSSILVATRNLNLPPLHLKIRSLMHLSEQL